MRLHKKFLAVLLTLLLATLAIIAPLSPVLAVTPAITVSVSPAAGPPGTVVYVTGTPCTVGSTYTVYFGTTAIATGTVLAGGTVYTYFQVPLVSRAAYNISITTSGGDATLNSATFSVTPQITISKNTGTGGDVVTVTGNGFYPLALITIYFDNVALSTATAIYSDSYGQLSSAAITIPPSSGGAHSITAGDIGGRSSAASFSISSTMTISASTGAVGSSFTVSGTGFAASSALSFFIDSTAISVNTSTDASGNFTNVAVTVPAISGGAHIFKVKDAIGNTLSAAFTVTATMTVGPTTGPIDTAVAINGKGFLASSPISVTYDGAPVTTLSSLTTGTDGSINTSFKVPASASGNHAISVSDGTTTLNAGFSISSTSAINVTSGPVGTSVTASGSGFKNKGNITITYNSAQIGAATADTHGSFTTTFAIPPASTGAHSLVISDQTNTQTYTFTVTPTFNPLSPTSGYIGTNITVGGNGFGASRTVSLTYDNNPVTPTTGGTTDANGTFSVSFKAPVSKNGDHSVVVSDGTTSKTFTFTIDKTPPPVPTLSIPAAATKLDKIPTLSWTSVTDSNGGIIYTLQISKDAAFSTLILEKTGLTSTTYTLNTQIPQEKLKSASKSAPYYWRVKATDAASNVSAWTTPQTFLVGLTLSDYYIYIIMGVIAIMLGALGFVLGRLTRRVSPTKPVPPPKDE